MNYFFAFWEKEKKVLHIVLNGLFVRTPPSPSLVWRRSSAWPGAGSSPSPSACTFVAGKEKEKKKDLFKIISHGRRGEVSKQQAGLGKKKWKSYPGFPPPLPTKESGARKNTDEKGRERKGGKNSLGEKRERERPQNYKLLRFSLSKGSNSARD